MALGWLLPDLVYFATETGLDICTCVVMNFECCEVDLLS
jgi:hypothetical protein